MRSAKTLKWKSQSKKLPKLKGTEFKKLLKSFLNQKKITSPLLLNVVKKLESMSFNICAFSSEEEFVRADVVGAVKWIEGEVKAFNEGLTGRGGFCSCEGARGIVFPLEKDGCDHVNSVI